jgi:hypothetical protein
MRQGRVNRGVFAAAGLAIVLGLFLGWLLSPGSDESADQAESAVLLAPDALHRGFLTSAQNGVRDPRRSELSMPEASSGCPLVVDLGLIATFPPENDVVPKNYPFVRVVFDTPIYPESVNGQTVQLFESRQTTAEGPVNAWLAVPGAVSIRGHTLIYSPFDQWRDGKHYQLRIDGLAGQSSSACVSFRQTMPYTVNFKTMSRCLAQKPSAGAGRVVLGNGGTVNLDAPLGGIAGGRYDAAFWGYLFADYPPERMITTFGGERFQQMADEHDVWVWIVAENIHYVTRPDCSDGHWVAEKIELWREDGAPGRLVETRKNVRLSSNLTVTFESRERGGRGPVTGESDRWYWEVAWRPN